MTLDGELLRCKDWIEAALEYAGGTHDFGDIVDAVRAGNMQFWPAPKGCIITELITFPKKRVLHCFLIGGELDQILEMEASLLHFAKLQECETITGAGRQGWRRVMKSRGWKDAYSVISKELRDE